LRPCAAVDQAPVRFRLIELGQPALRHRGVAQDVVEALLFAPGEKAGDTHGSILLTGWDCRAKMLKLGFPTGPAAGAKRRGGLEQPRSPSVRAEGEGNAVRPGLAPGRPATGFAT
jgi:hypothetical protein